MINVGDNLKIQFKQRGILIQLIIINISVFLIVTIIGLITKLFKLESLHLINYLGVPSDLSFLLSRPWTPLTYMFVHAEPFHILFNMLFLYWFGQFFLIYFTPRNLGSLYILGGLSGAAVYILAFNLIPYYIDMGNLPLIGASASATAIMFAAACYNPNAEVNLFFTFRVKIIYIALFIFAVDFISLASENNPGGHIAHIGGALLGYIFAREYSKGKDITRWMSNLIDWLTNLLKSKPSAMKVKYKRNETDYEYNRRKDNDMEEIDHILDKIKASGYNSLTSDEKKRLFDAGKK